MSAIVRDMVSCLDAVICKVCIIIIDRIHNKFEVVSTKVQRCISRLRSKYKVTFLYVILLSNLA